MGGLQSYLNLVYPRRSKTELGFEVEDYSKEEADGMNLPATPERRIISPSSFIAGTGRAANPDYNFHN